MVPVPTARASWRPLSALTLYREAPRRARARRPSRALTSTVFRTIPTSSATHIAPRIELWWVGYTLSHTLGVSTTMIYLYCAECVCVRYRYYIIIITNAPALRAAQQLATFYAGGSPNNMTMHLYSVCRSRAYRCNPRTRALKTGHEKNTN